MKLPSVLFSFLLLRYHMMHDDYTHSSTGIHFDYVVKRFFFIFNSIYLNFLLLFDIFLDCDMSLIKLLQG